MAIEVSMHCDGWCALFSRWPQWHAVVMQLFHGANWALAIEMLSQGGCRQPQDVVRTVFWP